MTYFKNVFVKSRNFVIEYSKIPKTESYVDFDRTFRVKIPKSGDLLAGVYIDFKLKDLLRTGADYADLKSNTSMRHQKSKVYIIC